MSHPRLARRLLIAAPLAAIAACAAPPPLPEPTAVAQTLRLTATVESVDMAKREVLLRGPGGDLITVEAGPAVRNLAQVRPGDRVVVEYTEAVAVALAPPGGGGRPPAAAGTVAGAAPLGARPGGAVVDATRVRVTIQRVEAAANRVTFLGPRGIPRTVVVREPAMQEFARRLRPGDEVEVAFVEALATRVEPAPR